MPLSFSSVDILILGAGWTSTFLIPLCEANDVSYVATTRHQVRLSSANPKLVYFDYDPTSSDPEPFKALPDARTVLITFPIKLKGASERLVKQYEETHKSSKGTAAFIQLGSTGIWDVRLLSINNNDDLRLKDYSARLIR